MTDVRPPVASALIGRSDELELLRAKLRRAGRGSGSAVLVLGEAGVGKTRLVRELAAEAERSGAAVLNGGCIAVGGEALRHAPFIEVLRTSAPGAEQAPMAGGKATDEVLEQVLGLVDAQAARGLVLVIIEDLHWADPGTCQILGVLARQARRLPMLLVVTVRDDELVRAHPVHSFLTGLAAPLFDARLQLPRLTVGEVAALLDTLDPEAVTSGAVAAVYRRTGGNPLLVEELCASGVAAATRAVEGRLLDVLLTRFETLSPIARAVVAAVAVAGRPVDEVLLGAVVDDTDTLSAGLREAADRHVLRRDGTVLELRHALMAEAVNADLLASDRKRLHTRWAEALDSTAGAPGGQDPALLAHHWYEAGRWREAFAADVAAAGQAAAALAHDAAYAHFSRAIALWDRIDDPAAAAGVGLVELCSWAGESANRAGQLEEAIAAVEHALAPRDTPLDPGIACLLRERKGWYLLRRGEAEAARSAYLEAVRNLPPGAPAHLRARVLAGSVRTWERAGDHVQALATARAAVAAVADGGAIAEEAQARYMLARALLNLGEVHAALEELDRTTPLAEATLDVALLATTHVDRAAALGRLGRLDDAVGDAIAAQERLSRRGHGDPHGFVVGSVAAGVLHRLGRPAAGRGVAAPVLAGATTPVALALGHLLVGLFDLEESELWSARNHLEVARVLAAPLLDGRVHGMVAIGRAELALAERDPHSAGIAVAEGVSHVQHTGDDEILAQLHLLGLRVEAERLASAVGRATRPAPRSERRRADAIALHSDGLHALLARQRSGAGRPDLDVIAAHAEAERTRIEGASDPEVWHRVARGWAALQWPRLAAYAELRRAEALLARQGSRDEAAASLGSALLSALAVGGAALVEQVLETARRARIELPTPGGDRTTPPRAERRGRTSASLTPREEEVLDLVATGATNQQIAARLFISEKTASVHVSRILAKLGVESRNDAATFAHTRRRGGPDS